MATQSKLFIQVGESKIEILGDEKTAYLEDLKNITEEYESSVMSKVAARAAILDKLNITEEEARLLLG